MLLKEKIKKIIGYINSTYAPQLNIIKLNLAKIKLSNLSNLFNFIKLNLSKFFGLSNLSNLSKTDISKINKDDLDLYKQKLASLNLENLNPLNLNILQNNKLIKIFAGILIIIFLFTHVIKSILNFKFHSYAPLVVAVHPVMQKDVKINVTASGKVQPFSTVSIRPQIDGIILNTAFVEGQMVQKGQLLFEIDPASLQALHNQALANLERSKADLINADLQLQKYNKLYKNRFVSDQDYQQTLANFKMIEASVAASVAAVDAAKVQLDFTKIYSPITGVAGQIFVDTGNAVKAMTGTSLVNINQVNPINVLFNLPEEHLPELIKNINNLQELTVNLSGFNNVGKLIFFDNEVDNLNGTIALKAEFCNCDLSLWPGKFVNVSLAIKNLPNALVVPSRAIQVGQQGAYVYVTEKTKGNKKSYFAKAKKTLVTIGSVLDEETVIVDGLQAGQIVITEGHSHVADNSIVEIYEHK